MRYRDGKIKQEHSIIQGIRPLIEELALFSGIQTIIPGRIRRIKGNYPKAEIFFSIATPVGCKLFAKSGRAAQEVFVVCNDEETLHLQGFLSKE